MTNEAKRNEDTVEPLVRLGLLFVGITLTITGWALDWRGYVQGVGGGMCLVLTVWGGFAFAKVLKSNAPAQGREAYPAAGCSAINGGQENG